MLNVTDVINSNLFRADDAPGPVSLGASGTSNAIQTIKLRKAAGEFESMLLENLWKSMKETFSDHQNDKDADPTLQSFDDWGIHAMAGSVGNAGGLGIKNMIIKYLEPRQSMGELSLRRRDLKQF